MKKPTSQFAVTTSRPTLVLTAAVRTKRESTPVIFVPGARRRYFAVAFALLFLLSLHMPAAAQFQSTLSYAMPGPCGVNSFTYGYPQQIVAADFNGDNNADLAVLEDGCIQIFLGKGDGSFSAAASYVVSIEDWGSIAVGDVNGDGRPDLMVAAPSGLSVLLGNGDGTFTPGAQYQYAASLGNAAVAVGDFNNDGKLDVAVAGCELNGNGVVEVFLGNGDGTFQQPASYPAGTQGVGHTAQQDVIPAAIVVGDFNGDGQLDIVTANSNLFGAVYLNASLALGSLSVLSGNKDGTFQPAVNYDIVNTVAYPWSMVAQDFNGDGHLDLALADFQNNEVAVINGNGDGTFANAVDYPAGKQPAGIAVGDFNGDGYPDLVVSNQASSNIQVLLNGGTGQFTTAGTFIAQGTFSNAVFDASTGTFPDGLAVAAFNANTLPDVAAALYGGDEVEVFLNSGSTSGGTGGTGGTGGSGSGGGTSGSGSCTCTQTGDYVNPAPAVDPTYTVVNEKTLTSPNDKYTASFIWNQNPVQNVSITVTLNSTGATVFSSQNLPYTTNFGFSPDDDRFVINNTQTSSASGTSEDYVYVYDLTSKSNHPIVTASAATSEARLQFSPSGRFFLYTVLVNASVATLQIYRVQGVTSQDLIYNTEFNFEALATSQQDQFGGVDWGFGPGSPETSFVYAYATGQTSFQWTLVNLASGRTVQNASITNVADYWQFNPCGSVVALISQPSSTSTQVEVTLYNTSTGAALSGSGGSYAAPISLEGTASGEEIQYSGQTGLLSASICGQANTSAGSNSSATPMDSGSSTSPIQLTFSNVTQLGETTATITGSAPSPPVATDFQLGDPAVYYDLSTTAVFSGSVTICINYGGITFINPSQIQLFHYANGTWANITTSVNTTTQTVCGSTTSFSPFALFEPSSPLPQTVTASLGTPQQATINATFATPFQATVTDTNGNPMPGIPVTFAAPLGGPTGIFTGVGAFATTTTGSNGVAIAPVLMADGFAGSYTVTASVAGVSNPANFLLANSPTAPSISWIPASPITYGTPLAAAQLDATASVPGSIVYNPALGEILNAGTQALSATFTPTDNVDYTSTTATTSITVAPAALTVSAYSVSRPYGAANPLFTASLSGFVNGDSAASLTGTLSCTSAATLASAAGTYAINCSGLSSSNYTMSFVPGTLTITAVPLTITANNQTRQYGAPNPAFNVSYSGFVNGDSSTVLSGTLNCTSTANTASPVGTYPINCGGLAGSNYTIVYSPGSLTVTQAVAAIAANNQTKNLDSPNPTLTWTATGFVNGDTASVLTALPSCTTTATTTSQVGIYPITCSGAAALNYSFYYAPGTLTVVCHYVSIALSPSTVLPGGMTTVHAGLMSCASTTQVIVEQFTVSGPLNPETCGQAEAAIFDTPPFPLAPKTDQIVSFPFLVPKLSCTGTFTIKATTLVSGKVVDSSTATLLVQ